MKSRVGWWLGWLLALVGVGLGLRFLTGFPRHVTLAALRDADPWLLVIALAVNLSSLAAKGWGWHLILKPVAPHSGRVAQEANLVGRGRARAPDRAAGDRRELGGLLRPTPANVGVTQAALVVGLLPFGVAPEHAVAAGLALQALQVLPVLFLGAMLTGWRLLKLESELA